jgi:antitoxin (DNA-binding transcriptional repressor) of toxin-antitoxin stability system
MKVSAQYAETHFAEVLATARRGESVEIAEAEMPTLKLVISNPSRVASRPVRIPGRLAGNLGLREGWETEFASSDQELTRLMVDAPLTTSGDI